MIRPTRRGAVLFLLIFGLFWSIITLMFDGFALTGIYRQTQAESYATTTGTITHSSVDTQHDDDGTTYRFSVAYDYTVNGRPYTSTHYRFGDMGASNNRAYKLAHQYPVGTQVTVHYDPANPDQAVLKTGVEGMDVLLLVFLTPFNCVMLALWAYGLAGLRPKRGPLDLPWKVIDKPMQTRLRPSYWRVPWAGVIGAGGSAFVAVFVLAFGMDGQPSLHAAGLTFVIIGLIATLTMLWQWQSLVSGKCDYVIDDTEGTIHVPFGNARSSETVPTAELSHIEVNALPSNNALGKYRVVLVQRPPADSSAPHYVPVRDTRTHEGAEAIANYLRVRLGMPLPEGQKKAAIT